MFYYLLLSGKYVSGLPQGNINSFVDHQFGLQLKTNPKAWKSQEVWPDNQVCKNLPTGPRLFLICNPTWDRQATVQNLSIAQNTHTLLLYTDIRTQMRLAYDKQAYWFTDVSRQKFCAPDSNYKYIKHILRTNPNQDAELDKVRKIFCPDQELLLQSFIKNKTILGFDTPNQQQIDFLDHWIDLQPSKSLAKLK